MEPSTLSLHVSSSRRVSTAFDSDYEARLRSLSGRERALVDLAAEGLTDGQIALVLGLRIAMVNSYWVRVRTKLGSFSRVEIVIDLLRYQSGQKHLAGCEENERLTAELERRGEQLREMHAIGAALEENAWPLLALLHASEAILVVGPSTKVLFGNRQAQRLFGAAAGELEGLHLWEMTATLREPCGTLFEADGSERETLGVDEPFYARRRDGSNFRAIVHAERFHSAKGFLAVVAVKEYLGDLEPILKVLCRSLNG